MLIVMERPSHRALLIIISYYSKNVQILTLKALQRRACGPALPLLPTAATIRTSRTPPQQGCVKVLPQVCVTAGGRRVAQKLKELLKELKTQPPQRIVLRVWMEALRVGVPR